MWWKRKQPSVDCTQPTGHPGPWVGAAVGAEVGGVCVGAEVGGVWVGAEVGGVCVGAEVGGVWVAAAEVGTSVKDNENANWSNRNLNKFLIIIFIQ